MNRFTPKSIRPRVSAFGVVPLPGLSITKPLRYPTGFGSKNRMPTEEMVRFNQRPIQVEIKAISLTDWNLEKL